MKKLELKQKLLESRRLKQKKKLKLKQRLLKRLLRKKKLRKRKRGTKKGTPNGSTTQLEETCQRAKSVGRTASLHTIHSLIHSSFSFVF